MKQGDEDWCASRGSMLMQLTGRGCVEWVGVFLDWGQLPLNNARHERDSNLLQEVFIGGVTVLLKQR